MSELKSGAERDRPFLFFYSVQGGDREARALGDLPQSQTVLHTQSTQTMSDLARTALQPIFARLL